MASEAGRGAQVRLDDAARQLARGGTQLRLVDNATAKAALEAAGLAPSGLTPDGSLPNGTAAEDEVLTPGGIISGGGGGGGLPSFTGGAIVSNTGVFYFVPPGPYPDDAAAAAGLVPVGAAYRHTSGVVIVREA